MDQGGFLGGKVCLITGAARGIGKGIAENFARQGAIVYANARSEGCMDGWIREVFGKYGATVHPVYFDVTDTKAMKECFSKIYKEEKRLDVLVNNAGITGNERIGMIREDTVERLFRTNVFAVIQSLQLAARIMQRQKKGSIINISSVIGEHGAAEEMAYSGTKGAVIAITKSAAKELAQYGIRVNSVAPGYADTDMFRTAAGTQGNIDRHIANIGLNRLAVPEDIAEACVFLASDKASYITGQILGVNGGLIL